MNFLFITNGDAENRRTWSGVPNLVLTELRRQGYGVTCLDMSQARPFKYLRIIFNRIIRKIWRPWRWVAFETTGLGIALQNRWLRRQVQQYPGTEKIIAFTYCLSGTGIDKPLILIHDWTNGYLQQLFHCRPMTAAERAGDERQFAAMRTVKKVVSLYPKAAEYMREHIGDKVKFYGNPINVDGVSDVEASITGGIHSKHILLVGGVTYQANVECAIAAANLLNDPEIVIDVVGVKTAVTRPMGYKVNFFGYLNKSIPDEKEKYECLFRGARCFVNVRKGWGGGSSVAEALYKGVPVIVGDYADIVAMYGKSEDFGCYCEPENVVKLADKLKLILNLSDDSYASFCRNAHRLTMDYTYSSFVAKVLEDE